VGRPLSLLLTERDATVTLCHIFTKDTPAECRGADIVVVAVGKPGLLRADHVKAGAVVIDVGINRVRVTDAFGKVTEKTVGDVDFEEVAKVAGWITPVPGGVGPMTVAMLLRNTVRAAKLVYGMEKTFGGK
jgi:methylenetetrahydrofolate dehydrogenase (NADP+)/methenyltetrahydrofolate cyclohydrolase